MEDLEDDEEDPVKILKNAQTIEDHDNLEIDNDYNNSENEAVNEGEGITDNSVSEKNIIGKLTKHIYRWHNGTPPTCDISFTDEPFGLPSGNFIDFTTLDYFRMVWKSNINKLKAEQINLFNVQKDGKSILTTPKEIEQFIGIQMLISIIEFSSFTMYWAGKTRYPPYCRCNIYIYNI